MKIGWVRAYTEENKKIGRSNPYYKREERAGFRQAFRTELKENADMGANVLANLKWGDEVNLPHGLSNTTWTEVKFRSKSGFVLSKHLVEVAYVRKKERGKYRVQSDLKLANGDKKKLLWGDLVQVMSKTSKTAKVRVRGLYGSMSNSDLTHEPLLEVYFIDVGQGDGVMVRTPDHRHLVVDGGLERTKQQTGKNAADFVDWKFFQDYGHHSIILDSMMASHSDNDHYGGLHDLVRDTKMADRELDCSEVKIKTFHHPGLSRWKHVDNANPPHKQGLGPAKNGFFIQLLGDRDDAEAAVKTGAAKKLSGPWEWFIEDVLENDTKTKVERVLVMKEDLQDQKKLPLLWPSKMGCDISVLGPVAQRISGHIGMPDFGKKSFNTNGHSICLRLDYGNARILLTGDLNTESMKWLENCYGGRMGAWECDVAKSCHHGSNDISYKFLEKIRAAATVISSGDAEGHAHPRPEIVGASVATGFHNIDRANDRLITPLVYMTEIERSVSLGALNRIDIKDLPAEDGELDVAIPGRHIDEMPDKAFLFPEDLKEANEIENEADKKKFLRDRRKENRANLKDLATKLENRDSRISFHLTVPNGAVSPESVTKNGWRSRIMEKNHYGLVNVRTDGELIMCATLNETENKWITHTFPARF